VNDNPNKPRYEHDERSGPTETARDRRRFDRRTDEPAERRGDKPLDNILGAPFGIAAEAASVHDAENAAAHAAERTVEHAAAHAEATLHADVQHAKKAAADLHRANWKLYVGEFWRGDLGLTLLSISFAVEIFVITPLREVGVPGRIFFNLIVGALMISAAIAGSRSLVWKTILIAAVGVTGIVLIASRLDPSVSLHLFGSVLTSITLLLYVHVVLVVMFRGGPITWSRIQGAVVAYFLVGMAFASAFEFIETRTPGSFQFMSQPVDLDQLTARMTYYSFSVLTTVGSPITTTDAWARSLTTAEAIIGQLFPTMLIGALVAMAIQARPKPPSAS
jgi:hypothetical protein